MRGGAPLTPQEAAAAFNNLLTLAAANTKKRQAADKAAAAKAAKAGTKGKKLTANQKAVAIDNRTLQTH